MSTPRPRRWPNTENTVREYLSTVLHFEPCPRCGAMADAAVAGSPERQLIAVRCPKCRLSAWPPTLTVWGEVLRCELRNEKPMCTIADGVERARRSRAACQIWIGDVLAATWTPEENVRYYNGHCGSEE